MIKNKKKKLEMSPQAANGEVGAGGGADLSVSAACQCTSGEGLDGDGGLSDHEEQLSDYHHAEGLLDD